VRQEIADRFRQELADCRDLMRLALRMLGCEADGRLDIPRTPVDGVGDWSRALALGLYAKACKLFRVIIITGESGFGGEMTVLTRCLFEVALTLNLIMKEQVALKRDGVDFNPDRSRPLTTDFRTLLYGAHNALMAEKELSSWGQRPELHGSMDPLGDPAAITTQATRAKNAVGEAWWKALKAGQFGLSVKHRAESLGLTAYYVMIYGQQSGVVHADDAFDHFDLPDGDSPGMLDLTPSADGIGKQLHLACLAFFGCLSGIHNRLKFGADIEAALNAFTGRMGVPRAM
jgi:hypothetical protein